MIASRRIRTVVGLALWGVASGVVAFADAAETGLSTNAVGAWTLKREDGTRECRVTLRADAAGPGYGIGMPVGCHLAFPFLGTVKMWNEMEEGKIQLQDAKGQPVVALEAQADGVMTGIGGEGEMLRFKPEGTHRTVILKAAANTAPVLVQAANAAVSAVAKPLHKLPLPSIADMAGHYAVLRSADKDTGCMVTLDDKSHGPNGALKANLAPACRDQGIMIFDPVGWQFAGGRLVLTARKGHTTAFDLREDGTWAKDAAEGKSLALKKM